MYYYTIWKPVKDFPAYEVSNTGLVRKGDLILKQAEHTGRGSTYRRVMLHNKGKRKHTRVHRLVAEAFCTGPRLAHVNHINYDSFCNHAFNLEWSTHIDNCMHRDERYK